MRALGALLRKEIFVEFRTLDGLALMLALALLLSVVAGLSLSGSFLAPDSLMKVYPALLWVVFIFTATMVLGRSFDFELRDRALEGLLLDGAQPWMIFLSKCAVNSVIIFFGQCLSVAILAGLLNVPISAVKGELVFLSLLAVIGYSALATLLAAISSSSRLKNMLLPLILLPLLFPLFFAVVELTAQLMTTGYLDLTSGWLSLLVGLDVVYIMLGVNLYEFAVRE